MAEAVFEGWHMIVSDSQVVLRASREAVSRHQQKESLTYWERDRPGQTMTAEGDRAGKGALRLHYQRFQASFSASRQQTRSVTLDLSEKARHLQEKAASEQAQAADETSEANAENKVELEVSLVRMLVERFTGRKMQLFDPRELQEKKQDIEQQATDADAEPKPAESEQEFGWGLRYQYHESHFESEKVSFRASAIVNTADGQQIELDLELNMSREFYSEESISLQAGDALKDPLVINYSGSAAELTQHKFSFDIDSDGEADEISFVRPGSGFLAYDKNDDGQINDGSELFGASSGDGFAELSAYDEDGNRWIDANDSIYDKLRIWSKDADGNDYLVALADRNVGAIYLGSTATQFSLNDAENQQLGQVRQTGIYIGEDGSASTVQQLDLVV
ncbi:MAG: hypothetical protein PVG66_14315 [Chromatiales bacterium]|jgi:hypothetical protein